MPSSDVRGRQRHLGDKPWLMREDVITYSSAMAEFMGALLLQLFAGSTTNALRIAAVFTALSKILWLTCCSCFAVSINSFSAYIASCDQKPLKPSFCIQLIS